MCLLSVGLLGREQVEAACPTAGKHLSLPVLQPVLENVTEEEQLGVGLLDQVTQRGSEA